MKKLSQLNESLWKSGIHRAKNNTPRIENHINSNVYKFKGIDLGLPFLVADDILEVNGHLLFYYDEYMKGSARDEIEKLGWRMPTMKELDLLRSKTEQIYREDISGWKSYIFKNVHGRLVLTIPNQYIALAKLLADMGEDRIGNKVECMYMSRDNFSTSNRLRTGKEEVYEYLSAFILLIKDKK